MDCGSVKIPHVNGRHDLLGNVRSDLVPSLLRWWTFMARNLIIIISTTLAAGTMFLLVVSHGSAIRWKSARTDRWFHVYAESGFSTLSFASQDVPPVVLVSGACPYGLLRQTTLRAMRFRKEMDQSETEAIQQQEDIIDVISDRLEVLFIHTIGETNRVFRLQFESSPNREILIQIHLALPLILFAAYPTIALVYGPLRRHRRRRKGLCVQCGYNLRGNMTGTCPECGQLAE